MIHIVRFKDEKYRRGYGILHPTVSEAEEEVRQAKKRMGRAIMQVENIKCEFGNKG